jgi:hypothetical protein
MNNKHNITCVGTKDRSRGQGVNTSIIQVFDAGELYVSRRPIPNNIRDGPGRISRYSLGTRMIRPLRGCDVHRIQFAVFPHSPYLRTAPTMAPATAVSPVTSSPSPCLTLLPTLGL